MSTIKRLAKNSGYLFFSGIATKILSFVALLYIARYLGPEDFGKFSFAFAFIYFFSFIPDLGIHKILVREASKEPREAGKLIGNGTIMKVSLSLVALVLAFFAIAFLDFPPSTKNVLYIASFGLLLSGISAYGVIYETKLRMEYSLFFSLASKLFFLALVLLAISRNLTLPFFVFASVSATFVHNFLMVVFSRKLVNVSFNVDPDLMKKIMREAIPVAIAAVFSVIYFRVDVLMLSFLKGDIDVGFYSAAYRLTEAFVFLPAAFTTSTFPLMSKYFKDSSNSFGFTYVKAFKYLFSAGLLVAVLVTFSSEKIILAIYGPEYQSSVAALQILIWATAIMFVNVLVSSTCSSCTANPDLGNRYHVCECPCQFHLCFERKPANNLKNSDPGYILECGFKPGFNPLDQLHRGCSCHRICRIRGNGFRHVLDSEKPFTQKFVSRNCLPSHGCSRNLPSHSSFKAVYEYLIPERSLHTPVRSSALHYRLGGCR